MSSQPGSSRALFFLVKSCWRSWLEIVFLYLTRRDSIWGLVRPVIELCWSYSTPKDCLLTLGTDTHRGLSPPPIAPPPSLFITPQICQTGMLLLHLRLHKVPFLGIKSSQGQSQALLCPVAHSGNMWDLMSETARKEIRILSKLLRAWSHVGFHFCYFTYKQSRKFHWKSQGRNRDLCNRWHWVSYWSIASLPEITAKRGDGD